MAEFRYTEASYKKVKHWNQLISFRIISNLYNYNFSETFDMYCKNRGFLRKRREYFQEVYYFY